MVLNGRADPPRPIDSTGNHQFSIVIKSALLNGFFDSWSSVAQVAKCALVLDSYASIHLNRPKDGKVSPLSTTASKSSG